MFFSHHKLHALKAHLTIFSVDWLVYKHMIYTTPVVCGTGEYMMLMVARVGDSNTNATNKHANRSL